MSGAPTPEEVMTIVAARELRDGMICFVGIGLPNIAANLARRLHAPDLVLIYESGTIGSKPDVLPLSIGDGELGETADSVVTVPEIFAYWLQAGRIDVGFLGAAQIDRFGDINTTVIGDYDSPRVRLPGSGGAAEIAAHAHEVVIMLRHDRRAFVERLDFRTTSARGRTEVTESGLHTHRRASDRRGERRGLSRVITDLGVLEPEPPRGGTGPSAPRGELVLTAVHPGVDPEAVRAATGWPLRIAERLMTTGPPTAKELAELRELKARSAEAHRARA